MSSKGKFEAGLAIFEALAEFFGERRRRKLRKIVKAGLILESGQDAARVADDLIDEAAETEGATIAIVSADGVVLKQILRSDLLALDALLDTVDTAAGVWRRKGRGD